MSMSAPTEVATLEAHPLLARIEAALDTLRPYLATDGGPMSPMTRAGLEDTVRKAVPEIRAVEAR